MSNSVSVWLQAARPRTLPASLSPIFLGNWLAYSDQQFSWSIAIAALVCAMALQVLVNFANDYFDSLSGVDTDQRLGPQRVMHSGLVTAKSMQYAMFFSALVASLSGVILIWLSSIWLLPLGILSLAGAYLYSGGPRPLASLGLGEVTVFLFFGLIAVGGSYFAQAGNIAAHAWYGAVVVGLPVSAIMLVNNIRDIKTDESAGKLTLAVRLGEKNSLLLYAVLLLSPAIMIAFPAHLPGTKSLGLAIASLMVGGWLVHQILQAEGRQLNPLLGKTANYSVLIAIVYAIAR